MKRNFLIFISFAVLLWMMYKITQTSLQSNLATLFANWDTFEENPYPWFKATLWDFYCNLIFILLWVWYKETKWSYRIFWTLLLPILGSPGTALYFLLQLFKLKPEEGLKELFSKQNH